MIVIPVLLLVSFSTKTSGQGQGNSWDTLTNDVNPVTGWEEVRPTPTADPNTSTPGSTVSSQSQTEPTQKRKQHNMRESGFSASEKQPSLSLDKMDTGTFHYKETETNTAKATNSKLEQSANEIPAVPVPYTPVNMDVLDSNPKVLNAPVVIPETQIIELNHNSPHAIKDNQSRLSKQTGLSTGIEIPMSHFRRTSSGSRVDSNINTDNNNYIIMEPVPRENIVAAQDNTYSLKLSGSKEQKRTDETDTSKSELVDVRPEYLVDVKRINNEVQPIPLTITESVLTPTIQNNPQVVGIPIDGTIKSEVGIPATSNTEQSDKSFISQAVDSKAFEPLKGTALEEPETEMLFATNIAKHSGALIDSSIVDSNKPSKSDNEKNIPKDVPAFTNELATTEIQTNPIEGNNVENKVLTELVATGSETESTTTGTVSKNNEITKATGNVNTGTSEMNHQTAIEFPIEGHMKDAKLVNDVNESSKTPETYIAAPLGTDFKETVVNGWILIDHPKTSETVSVPQSSGTLLEDPNKDTSLAKDVIAQSKTSETISAPQSSGTVLEETNKDTTLDKGVIDQSITSEKISEPEISGPVVHEPNKDNTIVSDVIEQTISEQQLTDKAVVGAPIAPGGLSIPMPLEDLPANAVQSFTREGATEEQPSLNDQIPVNEVASLNENVPTVPHSNVVTNTEAVFDTNAATNTEAVLDNKAATNTEAVLNVKTSPNTEVVLDKNLGTKMETVLDSKTSPNTEAVIDGKTATNTETVLDSNTATNTGSILDSTAAVNNEAVLDTTAAANNKAVLDNTAAENNEAVLDSKTAVNNEAVLDSYTSTDTGAVLDSMSTANTGAVLDSMIAPKTELVLESKTVPNTEAGVDNTAVTNTEALLDSNAATNAESVLDSMALTHTGEVLVDKASTTDAGLDRKATTNTESVVDGNTEANTEALSDSNTATKTDAVLDINPATNTEKILESNVAEETEAVLVNNKAIKPEAAVDNKATTNTEAVLDSNVPTKTKAVLVNDKATKPEEVVDSKTVANAEAVLDGNVATNTETVLDSNAATKPEAVVDNKAATNADAVFDSNAATNTETVLDKIVATKPEAVVDSKSISIDQAQTLDATVPEGTITKSQNVEAIVIPATFYEDNLLKSEPLAASGVIHINSLDKSDTSSASNLGQSLESKTVDSQQSDLLGGTKDNLQNTLAVSQDTEKAFTDKSSPPKSHQTKSVQTSDQLVGKEGVVVYMPSQSETATGTGLDQPEQSVLYKEVPVVQFKATDTVSETSTLTDGIIPVTAEKDIKTTNLESTIPVETEGKQIMSEHSTSLKISDEQQLSNNKPLVEGSLSIDQTVISKDVDGVVIEEISPETVNVDLVFSPTPDKVDIIPASQETTTVKKIDETPQYEIKGIANTEKYDLALETSKHTDATKPMVTTTLSPSIASESLTLDGQNIKTESIKIADTTVPDIKTTVSPFIGDESPTVPKFDEQNVQTESAKIADTIVPDIKTTVSPFIGVESPTVPIIQEQNINTESAKIADTTVPDIKTTVSPFIGVESPTVPIIQEQNIKTESAKIADTTVPDIKTTVSPFIGGESPTVPKFDEQNVQTESAKIADTTVPDIKTTVSPFIGGESPTVPIIQEQNINTESAKIADTTVPDIKTTVSPFIGVESPTVPIIQEQNINTESAKIADTTVPDIKTTVSPFIGGESPTVPKFDEQNVQTESAKIADTIVPDIKTTVSPFIGVESPTVPIIQEQNINTESAKIVDTTVPDIKTTVSPFIGGESPTVPKFDEQNVQTESVKIADTIVLDIKTTVSPFIGSESPSVPIKDEQNVKTESAKIAPESILVEQKQEVVDSTVTEPIHINTVPQTEGTEKANIEPVYTTIENPDLLVKNNIHDKATEQQMTIKDQAVIVTEIKQTEKQTLEPRGKQTIEETQKTALPETYVTDTGPEKSQLKRRLETTDVRVTALKPGKTSRVATRTMETTNELSRDLYDRSMQIHQRQEQMNNKFDRKHNLVEQYEPEMTSPALETLCGNSMFIDGIGYAEYPGYCDKLVQCYQYQQRVVAVQRECPYGYFWHQDQVLCRPPAEVPCYDDPCLDIDMVQYNRTGGCRSYFRCDYGISVPMCCEKGYRYNNYGCVPDPTCRDPCLTPYDIENRMRFQACKFLPDEYNPHGYLTLEHNGLRIRACPEGTIFSARQCGCRRGSGPMRNGRRRMRECQPDFYMNFNYGFKELSGSNMAFDVNNVVINDGAAQFNGNGRITLWGFMNKELGTKFAIRLRFKPDPKATEKGNLISNCGMTGIATVAIGLENHRVKLVAKSTSFSRRTIINSHFDPYSWNDITYVYDGNSFVAAIDGYRSRKPLGGLLETRSNAIVIGGCPKPGSGYKGLIDSIEVFSGCIPRHIYKPRKQR
ncbi:uncharacterized protein LOC143075688 [Mytilus galloprovincialis]|uniref:uncharacterized protein LOC143075688 n=1 Tax=Mytilus galloprovincialis TaxID=29158 RepID=UPI003F7C46F4